MAKCGKCGTDYGKATYQFCLECGLDLVSEAPVTTLPSDRQQETSAKTVIKRDRPSLLEENRQLKNQIKELKKDSVALFGRGEDPVGKRVGRILSVTGFKKAIMGVLSRSFLENDGKWSHRNITIPGHMGNFELYRRPRVFDHEDDDCYYVAVYDRPVDYQNELADISVLLHEASDSAVVCEFVVATNEDLSEHSPLLTEHFTQIKSFLSQAARSRYRLKIWDATNLSKEEHMLKIKVELPTKQKPVGDEK